MLTYFLKFVDKFWHHLPASLTTKNYLMDARRSAGITQGIITKLLFLFSIRGPHKLA